MDEVGTSMTARAKPYATAGSILLIIIGSLRVCVILISPFLVSSSQLENLQKEGLYFSYLSRVLDFDARGVHQYLIAFFLMWMTHIIIGACALFRQRWARSAAVAISGFYLIVLVGQSIAAFVSRSRKAEVPQYLFTLVIYAAINYCFSRNDVREYYSKRSPLPTTND